MLHDKHPVAEPLHEQMLLNEPLVPGKVFDPIIFEEITSDLIQKIAIKTKGAAGPSLFTADDWRRMLGSKLFGNEGMDL